MSVDRPMRNALAAVFLVAALFVAMNQVVASAPFADWWLPLVLFVLGAGLAVAPQLRRSQPYRDEADFTPPDSGVQTYLVTASPTPSKAPRLPTVTTHAEAAETESVLPFNETAEARPAAVMVDMETPVSPETPAPAAEPQPEPETEPTPVSPETPAPAAPAEPTVMSPETPTPDVETEVVEEGPSQRMPVERTVDTDAPAPELSHTAHTEAAEPEAAVARREAPATPPPDDSVTATPLTAPEKEVIVEKTAAPQQPYEAERVGTITPEQTARILDDSTDNAHDNDVPVVTESASAAVTAQERDGEGVVGSASDLTKINGVGRKSADALMAAGIDSFQKLANSSDDAIRAALTNAGVRLVGDVVTWSQQAAYAARGDWDGLKRFNAERRSASGD